MNQAKNTSRNIDRQTVNLVKRSDHLCILMFYLFIFVSVASKDDPASIAKLNLITLSCFFLALHKQLANIFSSFLTGT